MQIFTLASVTSQNEMCSLKILTVKQALVWQVSKLYPVLEQGGSS